MEIQKGMYGITQAGEIANDKIKLHLSKFGYEPVPITSYLWRHQTCPLQFSLVVDDFGIKYELQEDITHLLDALKTIFEISENWYGDLYCGIYLECYYYKREVLVSITNYVTKTLQKFQHPTPSAPNMHPINGQTQIMVKQNN